MSPIPVCLIPLSYLYGVLIQTENQPAPTTLPTAGNYKHVGMFKVFSYNINALPNRAGVYMHHNILATKYS